MFGFKDIGLGMGGGSGSLATGSFLPVPMPNGFPVTGGVSQVAGLGFPGIGEIIGKVPCGVAHEAVDAVVRRRFPGYPCFNK